jgi:A/G-specific adenine glycosylase
MKEFVTTLRQWYEENRRDLPWRNTQDPYPIWLSEVILQQTRVNQGLPYYHKFLDAFPTLMDLAQAPHDQVMRLWQGLGYYSRARNMMMAAQQVINEHNGQFPNTFESIRKLKGVGDYTAAAIASFAFNLPHAVVDGNVYRFLSRLTGDATPIDSNQGKKQFAELADSLLNKKQPGLHNQAMMEIGATVCLPAHPLCHECPFSAACSAFLEDRITELPVKSKKLQVKDRYFHYFLLEKNGKAFIRQRKEKDIWKGLYEFPLLETNDENAIQSVLKETGGNISVSKQYKHLLSHQRLHVHFYHIKEYRILPFNKQELLEVDLEDLDRFGFPQLIVRYLGERF